MSAINVLHEWSSKKLIGRHPLGKGSTSVGTAEEDMLGAGGLEHCAWPGDDVSRKVKLVTAASTQGRGKISPRGKSGYAFIILPRGLCIDHVRLEAEGLHFKRLSSNLIGFAAQEY